MKKEQIVWWHFSDIHWEVGASIERKRFLDSLYYSLEDNITKFGKPNLIFFTGDIAYSGESDQYDDFNACFLSKIRSISGDECKLFFVPGNHDLLRKKSRFLSSQIITEVNSIGVADELFEDDDAINEITKPFLDYETFTEQSMEGENKSISWQQTINVNGFTVSICGVNSAWASSYNKDDNGNVVDERHLIINKQQYSNNREASVSILLMHHPLTWLQGVFENQSKNHINKTYDFLLFGHTHTVQELHMSSSPSGRCVYLPSPALYERTNHDSIEYARGYNLVTFNPSNKTGEAHYFKYSSVYGEKFTKFLELFENNSSYFPILLNKQEVVKSEMALTTSEELLAKSDSLMEAENFFNEEKQKCSYQSHAVDLYDQLVLEYVNKNSIIADGDIETFSEMYFMHRWYMIVALQKINKETRLFQRAVSVRFREFIKKVSANKKLLTQMPEKQYQQMASLELTNLNAYDKNNKEIPERCLRYYMFLMLFSRALLYLDYPQKLRELLQNDSRVIDIDDRNHAMYAINIISAKTQSSRNVVDIQLRINEKTGFLLVSTFKHHIDVAINRLAEYWRSHHKILPPIIFDISYPLWASKKISSGNLSVETTPIVKLLMGKAIYGETTNVWFRELVQNAIDAVTMRACFEDHTFRKEIKISYDGRCCIIQI